jgi:hypothetical protein
VHLAIAYPEEDTVHLILMAVVYYPEKIFFTRIFDKYVLKLTMDWINGGNTSSNSKKIAYLKQHFSQLPAINQFFKILGSMSPM